MNTKFVEDCPPAGRPNAAAVRNFSHQVSQRMRTSYVAFSGSPNRRKRDFKRKGPASTARVHHFVQALDQAQSGRSVYTQPWTATAGRLNQSHPRGPTRARRSIARKRVPLQALPVPTVQQRSAADPGLNSSSAPACSRRRGILQHELDINLTEGVPTRIACAFHLSNSRTSSIFLTDLTRRRPPPPLRRQRHLWQLRSD